MKIGSALCYEQNNSSSQKIRNIVVIFLNDVFNYLHMNKFMLICPTQGITVANDDPTHCHIKALNVWSSEWQLGKCELAQMSHWIIDSGGATFQWPNISSFLWDRNDNYSCFKAQIAINSTVSFIGFNKVLQCNGAGTHLLILLCHSFWRNLFCYRLCQWNLVVTPSHVILVISSWCVTLCICNIVSAMVLPWNRNVVTASCLGILFHNFSFDFRLHTKPDESTARRYLKSPQSLLSPSHYLNQCWVVVN